MALWCPAVATVWSVVLPTARTGILTAVVLYRPAVGETAPLLFTISATRWMNADPCTDPRSPCLCSSGPTSKSSYPARINLAYTAALVLVIIVLFCSLGACAGWYPSTDVSAHKETAGGDVEDGNGLG